MPDDPLAHSYERQGKPQGNSNSNLSQAQQLITGIIIHLFFYAVKLASFCKKSVIILFAIRNLHNEKSYVA